MEQVHWPPEALQELTPAHQLCLISDHTVLILRVPTTQNCLPLSGVYLQAFTPAVSSCTFAWKMRFHPHGPAQHCSSMHSPPLAPFSVLLQPLVLPSDAVLIRPQGSPAPSVTPCQPLPQDFGLFWYLPFQSEKFPYRQGSAHSLVTPG